MSEIVETYIIVKMAVFYSLWIIPYVITFLILKALRNIFSHWEYNWPGYIFFFGTFVVCFIFFTIVNYKIPILPFMIWPVFISFLSAGLLYTRHCKTNYNKNELVLLTVSFLGTFFTVFLLYILALSWVSV